MEISLHILLKLRDVRFYIQKYFQRSSSCYLKDRMVNGQVKWRILTKMNKRSARPDVIMLLSHLSIHCSVSGTDALWPLPQTHTHTHIHTSRPCTVTSKRHIYTHLSTCTAAHAVSSPWILLLHSTTCRKNCILYHFLSRTQPGNPPLVCTYRGPTHCYTPASRRSGTLFSSCICKIRTICSEDHINIYFRYKIWGKNWGRRCFRILTLSQIRNDETNSPLSKHKMGA